MSLRLFVVIVVMNCKSGLSSMTRSVFKCFSTLPLLPSLSKFKTLRPRLICHKTVSIMRPVVLIGLAQVGLARLCGFHAFGIQFNSVKAPPGFLFRVRPRAMLRYESKQPISNTYMVPRYLPLPCMDSQHATDFPDLPFYLPAIILRLDSQCPSHI